MSTYFDNLTLSDYTQKNIKYQVNLTKQNYSSLPIFQCNEKSKPNKNKLFTNVLA
jgi:hypothetical protein